MWWSQEVVKPHLLTLICLARLVSVFFPFFIQFTGLYLIIYLSHHQPPIKNSSISLNMQRGAFADLPSAPHTFLRSEKLVQKSNLTKGCLESMAEASLCRGLMVC